jgi:hypothetical protein
VLFYFSESRDAVETTSRMGDRNASALVPARKSSIAVLSPRHAKRAPVEMMNVPFAFPLLV